VACARLKVYEALLTERNDVALQGCVKRCAGTQREAGANDIPQIISASGNQFLAARGGESQQNVFKSHRRRGLAGGRPREEPSHLSLGTTSLPCTTPCPRFLGLGERLHPELDAIFRLRS